MADNFYDNYSVVLIPAGSKARMPKLPDRMLGYARDERRLYIGTPNGNVALSGSRLDAYPVGAVYTSTVSTSPADLFGGTWVAVTPLSSIIKDDTTGEAYRIGVDNGLVYVEEVEDTTTYYSWKRTN